MDKKIKEIKEAVGKSQKITILTGAGISTESGISDFRSPGGVWSKYKTVTYQEIISSREKRIYYWKYKSSTIPSMLEAEPNAAHKAIADLDSENRLLMLLTQNIDGLHEKSGVNKSRIVNLHGTNSEAICLSCEKIYPIKPILDLINDGEDDPKCGDCGGILKPNTVSFGQNLDPEHLVIAERTTRECDFFMALGSSLLVQPACSYVDVAHRNGKPILIINRDPTPYDSIATYSLNDPLAEILPEII